MAEPSEQGHKVLSGKSTDTTQEASSSSSESNNVTFKVEIVDNKKNDSGTIATANTSTTVETKSLPETKTTNTKIVRGTKRPRAETGDGTDKKDDAEAEAKIMRSLKRSSELWSMEDKNTFFKAITEFGKDFDALQSYFLVQGKKKGLSEKMIKNKEQIRHFYYRTWLKISKHLKFSEDVKKTTQELYGLINYGELRRKLPRMHEKVQMKLNELVYWGTTQVRLRGKTMRIKTPICRTLRKLNKLEVLQEDIKLPSRVTIELRPGNNYTWWQIQGLAMNPRVRTVVPIQRRLFSILSFLQQRWRPWKPKLPGDNEDPPIDNKSSRFLRVAPPKGIKISVPSVNLGEYLTSNSVSFNSYEKRHGLKCSKIELLGSMHYLKGVGKKNLKKNKRDLKKQIQAEEQSIPDNSDIDAGESSAVKNTDKSIRPHHSQNCPEQEPEKIPAVHGFPGRESIDRIRLGWNIVEANSITVGDLLLMFGKDSKIILEYWWESNDVTNENAASEVIPDNALSTALQKLLSIAKHSYNSLKSYDGIVGSNETIVSSRTPSTKETVFRRPIIPKPYHRVGSSMESFKNQLERYRTRNLRKKGKIIMQRNIVQRVIPPTEEQSQQPQSNFPQEKITYSQEQNTYQQNTQEQTVDIGGQQVTFYIPNTNPKEIILGTDDPLVLPSNNNPPLKFDELTGNVDLEKVSNSNSSITSALRILKEGEWFNCDIADYSLSSFMEQLASPAKSVQRSHEDVPTLESIRPSSDISVSNMPSLIGENSIDYVAKFANYASQIVSAEDQK